MYLLDTDHISLLERGGVKSEVLRQRLRAIPPDDYGSTIVNYEEQTRGRLAQVASAQTSDAQVAAYERLQECRRIYIRFAVWDYTTDAAVIYADLKRAKLLVGTNDLRIAAIALANNAILLTCNRRDFDKVPGLRVEDWTI